MARTSLKIEGADEAVDTMLEADHPVEAMTDDAEDEYVPRTELGRLALAAHGE